MALSLLTTLLTATLGGLLLTLGADVLLETGFTAFLLTLDNPTPKIWGMVVATGVFTLGSILMQLRAIPHPFTSSKKDD
ncbi:hypothetical protein DSO57_1021639 [Entomophthora muscae]|uniref:Uncharacterized protein n=1 Tax=Entomophthora muscae TaxID=34485 RepID=A0ACC2RUF1_9FUNG|nr:hypothetical protein DSO57_1021639 [Entomophthora muscae]